MSSLQGLGSWGSNLLGNVGTHLGSAAGGVGELASSGLQKGSNLVRSSAKAVKSFTTDNLSGHFGASHSFRDVQGNEMLVTEVSRIAEGGFGEVLKVVDSRSGQAFALKKIVCQEGVQVASSLEAAEQEAQILQRLPPHPNIVRCLGFATETHPGGGSTVKLLMELCCGGHLLDFMDSKDGKLSAREVLEPFTQIVSAVRHLHVQQPPIQHRDLKVENVLQGEGGVWKLCDFGSCSTERTPAQELPRAAMMKLQEQIDKTVTMMYRPPEMADIELNFRNGYSITELVDIWMLGCILYTLAFYRHPFQDNATAMAITNAKYFIPYEHPLAKSTKLVALLHWLLAADPKDRPSAIKLCEVLASISKTSYESFHDSLPAAVQEKIHRNKNLFGKHKAIDADVPIPLDIMSRAPQTSQRRQSAPTADSQPTRGAAVAPKPRSNTDGPSQNPAPNQDGFDLRFALQPELMSGASSGGPSQNGVAKTSQAQKPSAAPPPPMTSDDLLSWTSPDTVGGPAVVTPKAANAPAMPDMNDLLGFSSAPEPAAPFTASFPDVAQSAPMPAQGSSPAVQDTDWCDFSSFSPSSVPMTQTGASANTTPVAPSAVSSPCAMYGQTTPSTLNNSLGEFDFADFVSASPTPGAQLTSCSPTHLTSTGQMPTNNAMPAVPSLPTAWAAPPAAAPPAAAAAPPAAPTAPPAAPAVVPVVNPAASLPDSIQAGNKPVQAAAPAGKPGAEATNDLSAMLSQQINLLDLS